MFSFVNRSALLILIFLILILSIKFKIDYKLENRFAPPPIGITKLTFGFPVVLADIFWIRSLQGFDYCEAYLAPNVCESKSWLYKNLSVMFTLDPSMQAGFYHTGALALSIVISDIAGASEIFDLGVRKHPKDWKLLYAAAYHALYEEKNKKKAALLYKESSDLGAPDWVSVLAGRLAVDSGDFDYAQKVLQTMIDTNQDEKLIKRLREKIESLANSKEKSNN